MHRQLFSCILALPLLGSGAVMAYPAFPQSLSVESQAESIGWRRGPNGWNNGGGGRGYGGQQRHYGNNQRYYGGPQRQYGGGGYYRRQYQPRAGGFYYDTGRNIFTLNPGTSYWGPGY